MPVWTVVKKSEMLLAKKVTLSSTNLQFISWCRLEIPESGIGTPKRTVLAVNDACLLSCPITVGAGLGTEKDVIISHIITFSWYGW